MPETWTIDIGNNRFVRIGTGDWGDTQAGLIDCRDLNEPDRTESGKKAWKKTSSKGGWIEANVKAQAVAALINNGQGDIHICCKAGMVRSVTVAVLGIHYSNLGWGDVADPIGVIAFLQACGVHVKKISKLTTNHEDMIKAGYTAATT